jgi:superfamily II DNA helicase RecQ
MPQQYKFFRIRVDGEEAAGEELNRFLRTVRVLTVRPELVHHGGESFWAVVVEYQDNPPSRTGREGVAGDRKKPDYREILPAEDFAVFACLREWRKEMAHQEAVPVYAIFTNDHLAKIAGKRITSRSGLAEIDGIGEARISKYGDAVCRLVAELGEGRKTGEKP